MGQKRGDKLRVKDWKCLRSGSLLSTQSASQPLTSLGEKNEKQRVRDAKRGSEGEKKERKRAKKKRKVELGRIRDGDGRAAEVGSQEPRTTTQRFQFTFLNFSCQHTRTPFPSQSYLSLIHPPNQRRVFPFFALTRTLLLIFFSSTKRCVRGSDVPFAELRV